LSELGPGGRSEHDVQINNVVVGRGRTTSTAHSRFHVAVSCNGTWSAER